MIVYAASTNPGKLKEFALAAHDIDIETLPNLKSIPPPEENGATFEENASTKAAYYSTFTSEVVLADDSGLEVDALHGAPGIHSARYSGPQATDQSNNELLLRNLASSTGRNARFVCAVALARAGTILTIARGTAEGTILNAPRGSGGFGYDPLFFYPPLNRSFAEVTPEDKFKVSHRGKALRTLFHSEIALHLAQIGQSPAR